MWETPKKDSGGSNRNQTSGICDTVVIYIDWQHYVGMIGRNDWMKFNTLVKLFSVFYMRASPFIHVTTVVTTVFLVMKRV